MPAGARLKAASASAGPVEAGEQVLRNDAERGLDYERGRGCGQPQDDGARVDDEHLDACPARREIGRSGEAGVLDEGDREGDVGAIEALTVVPEDVPTQVEGVGAAVGGDLPALGEVGQRGAVAVDAGEAAEDERGEVGIDLVVAGEQGIDADGRADDALDIAFAGPSRGFSAEGDPASGEGDEAANEGGEAEQPGTARGPHPAGLLEGRRAVRRR